MRYFQIKIRKFCDSCYHRNITGIGYSDGLPNRTTETLTLSSSLTLYVNVSLEESSRVYDSSTLANLSDKRTANIGQNIYIKAIVLMSLGKFLLWKYVSGISEQNLSAWPLMYTGNTTRTCMLFTRRSTAIAIVITERAWYMLLRYDVRLQPAYVFYKHKLLRVLFRF